MADDDPYNFEIEIPGKKSSANGGRDKKYEENSDDDGDSSLNSSPEKPKQMTRGNAAPVVKSSNALDKAKNFLSKYSSKQPTTGARSRVKLDLSDDEDESDEEVVKPSKGKSTKPSTNKKVYKDDISMDLSDDNEDEKLKDKPKMKQLDDSSVGDISGLSEFNDDEFKSPPRQSSIKATTKAPPPSSQVNALEESQDEPVVSRFNATPQSKATVSPVTATTSSIRDESVEDYSDEVEEISGSVQEMNNPSVVESKPQTIVAAPTETSFNYSMDFSDDDNKPDPPVVTKASAAEEDYLNESFVESVDVPPKTTVVTKPVTTVAEDEYLDESFAESIEVHPTPTPSSNPPNILTHIPAKLESDDYQDESFADSVVDAAVSRNIELQPREDDASSFERSVETSPTTGNQKEEEIQLPAKQIVTEEDEWSRQPQFPSVHKEEANNHPVNTASPRRTIETAPTRQKSKILIVREYEMELPLRVEMKDASTQFTGNHVNIQADLNPNQPERMEHHVNHGAPPVFQESSVPLPPTPPKINTFMERDEGITSMPSVNTSVSTGLYRQQLQQIQTQIRRKRLESERVMREAMTYRYTSMDAAEKFVSLNRPRKLALWEALMQVDPLMSKEKAMKIEEMSKSA